MSWIKGIPVMLTVRTQTGTDPFGASIYTDTEETVENVLVTPTTGQEVLDTLNLYGKRAVYTLSIPKGDTHIWENTTVQFFGETWRTIGPVTEYIEAMVPLDWNRKVHVERYGTGEV